MTETFRQMESGGYGKRRGGAKKRYGSSRKRGGRGPSATDRLTKENKLTVDLVSPLRSSQQQNRS